MSDEISAFRVGGNVASITGGGFWIFHCFLGFKFLHKLNLWHGVVIAGLHLYTDLGYICHYLIVMLNHLDHERWV